MPNFTASIPHRLGRADARRRIEQQLAELRQQSGALLGSVKETWTGDRMDFTLVAMGQTISGYLTIEEHLVNLSVALPWLLNLLARPVMQKLQHDVQRLLAEPEGKGGSDRTP